MKGYCVEMGRQRKSDKPVMTAALPFGGDKDADMPEDGVFVMSVTAVACGGTGPRKAAEARITETGRGMLCKLWVWDMSGDLLASGCGVATGGGYHRPSGALAAALRKCGFSMSENVQGAGDRSFADAVFAVCACVWPRRTVELIVSE